MPVGKLSTDVCPFRWEPHSLSVWVLLLFAFCQHSPMASAVRHLETLPFLLPSTEKTFFLVYHVISHLFRIWLPFFFVPIISALYIDLMCISAHSSHSCFYLLKYVQFTIIQTKYMMVSDESYWEIWHSLLLFLPPCFYFLYSHNFSNIYFKTSLINSWQNLKSCYLVPFFWMLWMSTPP